MQAWGGAKIPNLLLGCSSFIGQLGANILREKILLFHPVIVFLSLAAPKMEWKPQGKHKPSSYQVPFKSRQLAHSQNKSDWRVGSGRASECLLSGQTSPPINPASTKSALLGLLNDKTTLALNTSNNGAIQEGERLTAIWLEGGDGTLMFMGCFLPAPPHLIGISSYKALCKSRGNGWLVKTLRWSETQSRA